MYKFTQKGFPPGSTAVIVSSSTKGLVGTKIPITGEMFFCEKLNKYVYPTFFMHEGQSYGWAEASALLLWKLPEKLQNWATNKIHMLTHNVPYEIMEELMKEQANQPKGDKK